MVLDFENPQKSVSRIFLKLCILNTVAVNMKDMTFIFNMIVKNTNDRKLILTSIKKSLFRPNWILINSYTNNPNYFMRTHQLRTNDSEHKQRLQGV